MNWKILSYLLSFVLVGSAAIYAIIEMDAQRQLRATLVHLQKEAVLPVPSAAADADLHLAMFSGASITNLNRKRAQLGSLRQKLDRVLFQLRTLQRADGESPAAIWPSGASVFRAADWKPEGRNSPTSTMQSFMAAARDGNVDEMLTFCMWEPEARAYADEAFAKLPREVQEQYGTPAGVVAQHIVVKIRDYTAMAEVDSGKTDFWTTILQYRFESKDGDQKDIRFQFKLSAGGGWLLSFPLYAATESFQDLQ